MPAGMVHCVREWVRNSLIHRGSGERSRGQPNERRRDLGLDVVDFVGVDAVLFSLFVGENSSAESIPHNCWGIHDKAIDSINV
jgi:hypothetical protein